MLKQIVLGFISSLLAAFAWDKLKKLFQPKTYLQGTASCLN